MVRIKNMLVKKPVKEYIASLENVIIMLGNDILKKYEMTKIARVKHEDLRRLEIKYNWKLPIYQIRLENFKEFTPKERKIMTLYKRALNQRSVFLIWKNSIKKIKTAKAIPSDEATLEKEN